MHDLKELKKQRDEVLALQSKERILKSNNELHLAELKKKIDAYNELPRDVLLEHGVDMDLFPDVQSLESLQRLEILAIYRQMIEEKIDILFDLVEEVKR